MTSATPIPLTMLPPGCQARVAEVRAHGHGMRLRLASMGILPGTELSVVKGDSRGAIIVRVADARFVLGRGMAHHVFVEPGQ